MWKSIQHFLSLTADLLQIGGFFGLTPAALFTIACAIVGWISDIPLFYLAAGTAVVFAASVYLTRELIVRIGAVSLNEGARIAYEQLRGTLWGAAAERLRVDPSPDGILDYMATGIANEVPIFGKFPPSTKLERISARLLSSGSIKGGARVLQSRHRKEPDFTDLTIRKSHLLKAIRQMKESAKG